jgi:hypothetical protein
MRTYTKKQKEIVFEYLKTDTKKQALIESLNEAVKSNLKIPNSGKFLDSWQTTYVCADNSSSIKKHLEDALKVYFNKRGFSEFLSILDNDFNEKNWNSNIVEFFVDYFKIKLPPELTVDITIKDGKIYWRILEGEKVRYDHSKKNGKTSIFDESSQSGSTFQMTLEKFKMFKNAGKRNSTVKVTKDLFSAGWVNLLEPKSAKAKENAITRAEYIWGQLKKAGILDDRDRLSENWRSLSSVTIKIPKFKYEEHEYRKIAEVIYTIVNEPLNAKKIHSPEGDLYFSNFREDCSPKTWAKTGQVTNKNPLKKCNTVKLWDVGSYEDLNKHAKSNDGLEHDHIPATSYLNTISKTHKLEEDLKNWWAIAVPEELHSQSETYQKKQKQILSTDFKSNIQAYFELLQSLKDNPEYGFMAIAALRHLYRCQVKEHKPVLTTNYKNEVKSIQPIGRTPNLCFCKPKYRQKLDDMFVAEIKKSLLKI